MKFSRKSSKILPKKKPSKNPPKILPKNPKNLSFLIDFFTLAATRLLLEQSSILLGQIHASGRLSNNKELVHFHSQLTLRQKKLSETNSDQWLISLRLQAHRVQRDISHSLKNQASFHFFQQAWNEKLNSSRQQLFS